MNEHNATEQAYRNGYKKGRADAIKEFATALKTYKCIPMAVSDCSYVNCEVIDELVQEMVGDEDETL